ncbi:MAG TPA: ATP-dependent DNA helicase UvrD2 [Actinomycetota bacterium]|nr:ATP-dependent DNA helicase UvrD2 [Actinomycetota bacterium]
MPIRCHNCGGTHPDAQSVRECFASRTRGGAAAGSEEFAGPEDFWGDAEADSFDPQPPPAPRKARAALTPGLVAPVLGRSVLVAPGAGAPDGWSGCRRVVLDPGRMPEVVEVLEQAYLSRIPLVIEVEPGWRPPDAEICEAPVWSLGPGFSFPAERLVFALTANSLDARGGEPRWSWSSAAVAAGARAGGPADVILPDGRAAFIDGGPLHFRDAQESAPEAVVVPAVAVEHGRLAPYGSNTAPPGLAQDQQAAVTHPGGSARILAPAGSGKTRVLTERARHLLKSWRIPPSALTLVAFNKRAAEEIRARTADLPGLQIRTLNSLGLAILSGSGRFGGGRSVPTLDEPAVRRLLEELVSFPRRANTDPAAAWIEALSAVRLGLSSPERVEAEFQGDVDGLAEVFDRYRAALADRGVVDFDEQIYRAIEILLTSPELRNRARLACRVLLVDEFQDLTPAHLLLLRLLAGPAGSVFGVGDDDQTIYGYAGASPGWLIDYGSYFPGAGSHLLRVNYRCPPDVTEAARTLLTHNRTRVPKQIVSPPAAGPPSPGGLGTEVTEDPVGATAAAVDQALALGAEPGSIAVLARVNSSLAPIQLSLQEAGVPVNRAVDVRFLERTGVRAALAWLSLATNPGRLKAAEVGFTARRPPRALSPKVVEWMSEQRSVERIRSLAERLGERDAGKVNGYADDVERLVEVARGGATSEILRCLRDDIGLAAAVAVLDSEHRRLDRSPQTDDLDALIAIGKLHPDPSGFAAWLRDGLSRAGDPAGVTLATIHAVKGREWDHVVVHDATAGMIPHRLAADVEEERRVFHVALTRCRRSCTVVAGSPPSPFLEELTAEWVPGRAVIELAPRRPEPDAPLRPAARSPQAEGAFNLLRAWRLEKARTEGRPAYTVFHDSTLEAIAASGPRTLRDLALIKGIGPAKLENYGDEILAVLDNAPAG